MVHWVINELEPFNETKKLASGVRTPNASFTSYTLYLAGIIALGCHPNELLHLNLEIQME
jgi:hypothetical protein